MPSLDPITREYVQALLENKVCERKAIYKRDLPGGTDQDKKEAGAIASTSKDAWCSR
jgi:hypothetical protein